MENQGQTVSEIYQKFLKNNPEYNTQEEKLKLFVKDLRLHWEKMETLRLDMLLDTHEEVYFTNESQIKLIDLIALPPWAHDDYELALRYFDESVYTTLKPFIKELFELWDNNVKNNQSFIEQQQQQNYEEQ